MKAFTDNAGKTWSVAMTIDSVKRVRDLLGVNLVEPEAGEPPLLTRLGTDEILLCDVVYCLIKPQADALGVTDVDFGRALGGDAILAAQTALYEELVDFFQKRGRPDRARAVAAQKTMIEMAIENVRMKLDAMNPQAELARILGN
ncbi:MAG: hypothetical protein A2Y13_04300 [Planctomycetes bacterium GWC2_45_44]|nr:MAG: hypothetical protein A2Y13_04300 [Planctomycetes bacterium GWC2_45_44]HBR19450.1 hypothetical protein [Phycisphaerales bacterium]